MGKSNSHRYKKKTPNSKAEQLFELSQKQSSFFANISHEFRTPITLILAPLEKLLEVTPEDTEAHLLYLMMKRNAERLLNLINQLLDLSKLEGGFLKLEATPVNVVELLELLAATFAPLAEKRKINFNYKVPQERWNVLLDIDKAEKIVINLLSNACKFTPDGGEIRFVVKINKSRQKSAAQKLILEVSDNGIGIQEDQIDKIFDRFYQAENSFINSKRGSTGIGLSLTKELVELHGGTIRVHSKAGKGATFKVELPLQTIDGTTKTTANSSMSDAENKMKGSPDLQPETQNPIWEDVLLFPVDKKNEKAGEKPILLIVEDNAELSSFIAFHFKPEFQVIEAQNGFLGLEKAIETVPDMVVTDIMMPVMDGLELSRKLKADERTSHIPVILLSAKALLEDKIEGLQSGADDFITKPFSTAELKLRVKNLVEGRKRLRERFSNEKFIRPAELAITTTDEKFLKRVINIIIDHIDEADFTAEIFEREVGMSHVQFYRKMKSLTNQAPGEFLRNFRLQQAAMLLKGKHGNITEVAYTVGFSSLAYFTRCFKALYNQTPSEYIAASQIG